ncbi:MAG: hypothetical protein WC345_05050 [Smithellaceae bacterium]|jgi:hypothetical protein|nr:hypothetical protein [Smithellaceae bacterium]HOC61237.1 hypothetical protein [Smithellaceae bacterium]HOG12003.1 hypothetical protein [Smithellaceae bacterium]
MADQNLPHVAGKHCLFNGLKTSIKRRNRHEMHWNNHIIQALRRIKTMTSLGYELLIFLAIAIVIAVAFIVVRPGNKSDHGTNDSENKMVDPELPSPNSKGKTNHQKK